jgi:hypothetical protein
LILLTIALKKGLESGARGDKRRGASGEEKTGESGEKVKAGRKSVRFDGKNN